MKVDLIQTQGYALEAEIRIGDKRFIVADFFSGPDPETDRVLENVSLDAEPGVGGLSWDEMFQGNPDREKKIVRISGWEYFGFGQIVSLNPTCVDFGLLAAEVGPVTNDRRCIGEYVKVLISLKLFRT